ncbi:acyl-CoA thioester hydrolase/BAAT C-terminal domain-containing protein [Metabacillus halosaccharovorans]|uniref:acyl-CoA thioester hydrolase/BAAT C-terminal domain-containing protein n=1 Tax=Metabacillus halosaccharovorans TaxID=930124 RepID=UPI0034CE022B
MSPKLQINPTDSLIDEEILIKVTGCTPYSEVSIHATTHDEKGKRFCSYATFIANQEGVIDVTSQAPIEGTYDKADGSGLFWSMKHAESKLDDYFEKNGSDKISIHFLLLVDGETKDSATSNLYFYKDDVKKESVQLEQVKGTVFHPDSHGSYPAVIILGGSDGGMQEHAAALLASKGYVTFALSYFGAEGVPKDLENIPLEYFHKATMWLKNHPHSNGEVSLIGYSRGGELALLLGETYPHYTSVIAGAPSAYITSGMKNGIFAPVSSWILNEEPLPYMKFTYRFSAMFSFLKNWIIKKPISFLPIWDQTLKNKEAIKEARIAVEKIKAPIMFISGEDDQLWPSNQYVKLMEETLKKSNTPHQNQYLYYENSGHFSSFPYSFVNLPSNVLMNTGGGMTMNFGGSKSANAEAAKDSWRKILAFLRENHSQTKI